MLDVEDTTVPKTDIVFVLMEPVVWGMQDTNPSERQKRDASWRIKRKSKTG
jgi:hypothetical protein